MALDPAVASEIAGLGTAGVFSALGKRRAAKLQQKRRETDAGQAMEREEGEALARGITKSYGMSDAQRRKETAKAAEGARAELNATQRDMLKRVAAAGGLGRSGATTQAMGQLAKAKAGAETQAAVGTGLMSQKMAEGQKARDTGLTERRYLRGLADEKESEKIAGKMRETGYALGKGAARGLQIGAGNLAAGAGK